MGTFCTENHTQLHNESRFVVQWISRYTQAYNYKPYTSDLIAVFALCAILAAIVVVNGDAGRSACKDESEIGQTYTHHFDAAKYWLCEKLGEPATEMDCPSGLAYMHLLKECIPWASYIWKKPEFPPTIA